MTTLMPPRKPALSRRHRNAVLAGVAIAMAGLLGALWWCQWRFLQSTDDAYVQADVAMVSPYVAGELVEIDVQDNQHVAAGQVLARLDDRDFRARLAAAQAAAAAARAGIAAAAASLANLQAQSVQQESMIAAAQAELQARAAEAVRTAAALARQQRLSHEQATSAQQLEDADAAQAQATAALAGARAMLQAARQKLNILASAARQAQAAGDTARADLAGAAAQAALAQTALARTAILAPVAGTAGERSLRPGQYVEAGTPLLAIVPDEPYIVANYKETQLPRMRPGQPAAIAVDALGGATLHGHVDTLAPASGAEFALLPPDNATGNFTKIVQRVAVRIRLDPGQADAARLRAGESAVVTIDTRDTRDTRGGGDAR